MDQKLPSDALTRPARPLRTIGIAAAALLALGGLSVGGIALAQTLQPQVLEIAEIVETPTPLETPTEAATPTPEPEPAIVEEPAPPPADPTKCPEGTTANAVDSEGNETNCQPLNDDGQQCVAYDDANNCTQWYKP